MTEEFLHFVWRSRLFPSTLTTTLGEPVIILSPGEYNKDGGPDFFNARIRIGMTVWAGNVEIHVAASDWIRHHHQDDKAYDNIILHLVAINDQPIVSLQNRQIPTVEVKDQIPERIMKTYQQLQSMYNPIPCSNMLEPATVDLFPIWAPVLTLERIENRLGSIRQLFVYNKGDWEETFYQVMARAMGMKVNALPFELLAKSLPQKIIQRHRDELIHVEAMLFGQASLLTPDCREYYPKQLWKNYLFFKEKYQLVPLQQGIWKFLRMRPSNFPTIRISQFAAINCQPADLIEGITSQWKIADWFIYLKKKVAPYWKTHYTFAQVSAEREKSLGDASIIVLLINAIIPFMFFYGKERSMLTYCESGLAMLEELPGELNTEVFRWKQLGIESHNALETQALKQLSTAYCAQKQCLDCRIGARILR